MYAFFLYTYKIIQTISNVTEGPQTTLCGGPTIIWDL